MRSRPRRAVSAGDLSEGEVGILAAVHLGVNNARHEGLHRRVRLIVNGAAARTGTSWGAP